MDMWMKSKAGTFHRVGVRISSGQTAKCQSYNYDRIIELVGLPIETEKLPEGAKICKKCKRD